MDIEKDYEHIIGGLYEARDHFCFLSGYQRNKCGDLLTDEDMSLIHACINKINALLVSCNGRYDAVSYAAFACATEDMDYEQN